MDILKAWIKKEGRGGRKRLYEALKSRFPTIHPMSLTNYIRGDRIPDKERAEIMAEVMGVPIEALTYRFTHNPQGDGGNLEAQNA